MDSWLCRKADFRFNSATGSYLSITYSKIGGFTRRRIIGMSKFLKLIKNTKGATAIEYGLIAALIAVAAIAAMQSVGNKLNTTFNNVSNSLA
jgi:pilus assembly protein Flp/PilA